MKRFLLVSVCLSLLSCIHMTAFATEADLSFGMATAGVGSGRMYCPQTLTVDVNITNLTNDVNAVGPIIQVDWTEVSDFDFTPTAGLYNMVNSTFGFDSNYDRGSLSGYRVKGVLDFNIGAGIRELGQIIFKNNDGENNVNFSYLFDGLGVKNTDSDIVDTAGSEVLTSVSPININLDAGPCLADTIAPIVNITNVSNGAYRVDLTSMGNTVDFTIDDSNGLQYTYDPEGLGTYIFNSSNLSDTSVGNYSFSSSYTNAYGVNSGSIYATIEGVDYTDTYNNSSIRTNGSISRNGLRAWDYSERGHNGSFGNLSHTNFRVEEEITLTIYGADDSPDGPNQGSSSITFNGARNPEVLRDDTIPGRSPAGTANVDPELTTIKFRVFDDWAGVDSSSLVVTIRTGSITGPIIKSYNFGDADMTLSGVSLTWASEGSGGNAITHSNNYDISLTNFGTLPENDTIYVVVNGVDLAYTPNSFVAPTNNFSFGTRASCSSLQCGSDVTIYTGTISDGTEIVYTYTGLTVSGGTLPYISENELICHLTGDIDIYTGGTELSYGNSTGGNLLYANYLEDDLIVELDNAITLLSGNTLYVSSPEQTFILNILPAFRNAAGDYSSEGDFWLAEKKDGASDWTFLYNSKKESGLYSGVSTDTGGTGTVVTRVPSQGSEYLVVYKAHGMLSIGFTGIWENNVFDITTNVFDFTDRANNYGTVGPIYPNFTFANQNYIPQGDIIATTSGRYDLINAFDLTAMNNNLTISSASIIPPYYDFDLNNAVNVLEQSAILQFDNWFGFIEQYAGTNGLPAKEAGAGTASFMLSQ